MPDVRQEKVRELLVLAIDHERLSAGSLELDGAGDELAAIIEVQVRDEIDAAITLRKSDLDAVCEELCHEKVPADEFDLL